MANNRVELADGTVLMDISDTTAEASDVAAGKAFYSASGVRSLGTGNYMNPVANPTANDVLVTDANGQAVDSGVSISDLGTVKSVNGQTGTVVLQASDVGALPDDTDIPANTSDLTNDSGFITGMVILSYGNSNWQDFIEAYTAQKVVYCRASSNSNPASGSQTRLAFMAYVNNAAATSITEVEFQYYRSVSSHSVTQQGDQVYVYKLNKNNGWSVIVRENYTRITAGTNLAQSYSNGVLTLNLNSAVTDEINDVQSIIQRFQIFTDISQFGMSAADTVLSVAQAMPNMSMLITQDIANTITDYPIGWGLFEITKSTSSRWFAKLYSQNVSGHDLYYEYSCAGTSSARSSWYNLTTPQYHKGDTYVFQNGMTLFGMISRTNNNAFGAQLMLPKEIGSDISSITYSGSPNFWTDSGLTNRITGITISSTVSKAAVNCLNISGNLPSGTTRPSDTFGAVNFVSGTITFN